MARQVMSKYQMIRVINLLNVALITLPVGASAESCVAQARDFLLEAAIGDTEVETVKEKELAA